MVIHQRFHLASLGRAVNSSDFSSKLTKIALQPRSHASVRAVRPRLSLMLGSARLSSKARIASVCPKHAASCSAGQAHVSRKNRAMAAYRNQFVSRHVKLGRKTKHKDNMDQHKGGLGEEGGQGTCASVIVPGVTGLTSFHEHFDHFCVSCPSSKMQAAMSTFCT